MSQIKFVTGPKIGSGNLKSGDSLYGDIEEKTAKLMAEGWELVGAGPDREVLVHGNGFVELLRKIPLIKILINFLFPLDLQYVISVILKKD